MSEYPGFPTSPLIIFWSGDRAVFIREIPVPRDNEQYSGIYMILDPQTKWRYGITEQDLNYEISVYGAYYMEYPTQFIKNKSLNPENPMYIALCNFDGSLSIESEIQQLNNEINNLKISLSLAQQGVEMLQGNLKDEIELKKQLYTSS